MFGTPHHAARRRAASTRGFPADAGGPHRPCSKAPANSRACSAPPAVGSMAPAAPVAAPMAAPQAPAPAAAKPKSALLPLIFILGILLVFAVIVVLVFALRRH